MSGPPESHARGEAPTASAGGKPPLPGERVVSQDLSPDGDWKPRFNPWLIAVAVMLATFMEVLDTSVANVALPNIAGTMASSTDEAMWVLTSYLVANGIVLPATAWLSAMFGRKRFLITCIAAFTAASALCGAAKSLEFLVFARILQGAAGGALMPVSQTILLECFPKKQHSQAMAFFGLGVIVAPILGPVLGGWITDNYSWRWIFYINVPIGILAASLSHLLLEDPPYVRNARPGAIDKLGLALLALWVGTLQIVLDKGQQQDWFASAWILWLSVICVVSFFGWLAWELLTPEPVVNLRALHDRNLAMGTLLLFVVGAVLYGTTATVPLYLQTLMGYTSYLAGLALMPRGLTAALAMVLVVPLMALLGGRRLVGIGFAFMAWGCFALGAINLSVDMRNIILPTMAQGLAMGFIFVPLTTMANATLSQAEMANASGLTNLARNIGGSVGIALNSTFLARFAQAHQNPLASHMTPYDAPFQDALQQTTHFMGTLTDATSAASAGMAAMYGRLVQQATLLAFVDTFIWMSLICLLCVPLAFLFREARGRGPGMMH